jgi:hypothetical protein
MPTLSSNIVKREVASPKDVERALARQAIHGGDLVTNLLELVPLNEDRLTRTIAESLELEAGPVGELPRTSEGLLRLVPSEVARRHGFFPLEANNGALVVAVSEQLGEEAASDLEFSLGMKLVQRASTLVRVKQAIARDYGVPLDRRSVRVLARLDGKPDPSPSDPPSPMLERREPTLPPEAADEQMPRRTGSKVDLRALAGASPRPSGQRRRIGPYTVAMAEHDLMQAGRRDEVVTTFFEFASQYFEYAALFVVHGDLAEGRDAHGSGAPRHKVQAVGVPLDLPSTLSTLITGREPFRLARLSPSGIDGAMVKDLERKPGPMVLLMPVRVRDRAVLVLYGDHGDQDLGLDAIGDVISFVPLVTAALERVILKRKGVAPPKSIPPRSINPPVPARHSVPPARMLNLGPMLETPEFEHSPAPRPVLAVGPEPRVRTPAPRSLAPPLGSEPPAAPERESVLPPEVEPPPPPPPADFDDEADASTVIAASTGMTPQWSSARTTMGLAPGLAASLTRSTSAATEELPSPRAFEAREHGTQPGVGEHSGALAVPEWAESPAPPAIHSDLEPSRDLDWGAPSEKPDAPAMPSAPTEAAESVRAESIDDIGTLLASLIAGDPRAADRLVEIGTSAVPALVGALPGPILSELKRGPGDGPPRASDCGPLLKVLARIGPSAASMVAVRASDADPVVRAWTTRLLGELPSVDSAEAVALRFLDRDIEVRRAALAAGRMLASKHPASESLSAALSDVLLDPAKTDEVRHMAIEAIADLRESRAVPGLVRTLENASSDIKRSAHWALVVLTRADFGDDVEAWGKWWAEHSEQHRIEWLIEALTHAEQEIRRAAGDELKSTTKEYFGYYDDLSPRERERAQGRYRDWWNSKGKSRFGA